MATNAEPTMTMIDADYLNDDPEVIGGDAADLLPIDLDDPLGEDDDDVNYTSEIIAPDDLDKVPQPPKKVTEQQEDLVSALLRNKGIQNPHEINFEEEDGAASVKDFYELTPEEQLELLEVNDLDDNYGLDDNEIEAVNFLRENNVTLQEAIEYYQNQAIEEYKNTAQTAPLEIDAYTDEELYVVDLKTKYDDLTTEELEVELTKALENPDLFKKKVDKLRTDYKRLEDENRAVASQASQASQEEAYTKITNSLIDVANGIEDLYGIDLDVQDKEDIINAIVDRDLNGVTPLVKALDNPTNLFKAAWFVQKGEEAFNLLHDYYKREIEKVRTASYTKGKSEALKGFPTTPINRIGTQPSRTAAPAKGYKSVDDLHNIND